MRKNVRNQVAWQRSANKDESFIGTSDILKLRVNPYNGRYWSEDVILYEQEVTKGIDHFTEFVTLYRSFMAKVIPLNRIFHHLVWCIKSNNQFSISQPTYSRVNVFFYRFLLFNFISFMSVTCLFSVKCVCKYVCRFCSYVNEWICCYVISQCFLYYFTHCVYFITNINWQFWKLWNT